MLERVKKKPPEVFNIDYIKSHSKISKYTLDFKGSGGEGEKRQQKLDHQDFIRSIKKYLKGKWT